MRRSYSEAGAFSLSLSRAGSDPPEAIHRWRRINAMASAKVGAGLAYQTAVRWIMDVVAATGGPPGLPKRIVPSGLEWCARWPGQTTGAGSPHPNEPGFRGKQLPDASAIQTIPESVPELPPNRCTAGPGERIRLAGLESAPREWAPAACRYDTRRRFERQFPPCARRRRTKLLTPVPRAHRNGQ